MQRVGRWLVSLALPLAVLTCGEPVAPRLSITIAAGAGVTDTVDAPLALPLIVEVRRSDGSPVRGALVGFFALTVPSVPLPQYTVRLGPIGGPRQFVSVVDTVGADARAEVLVTLGPVAGSGGVEITVPELGLTDTALYTIRPGNAVRVVSEPADTVVSISHGFSLRTGVRDRHENVRADPVTYAADSSSATVSASGTVAGLTAGRARVRAYIPTVAADTSWVTVVPQATIAAIVPTGIAIVDLDGANYREVPGVPIGGAAWVDWNPRGDTLVYASTDYDSWVYVSDLVGAPRRLITDSTGLVSEYRPEFSANGQWIYFGGRKGPQDDAIWRVRSDGSGAVQVGPGGVDADNHPGPSSDGELVAYVTNRCCYPNKGLFVLHVSTGAIDSLAPAALTPRFSPGDSLLGFVTPTDGIWVLRPDGSALRRVSPFINSIYNYYQGFDWSPDGEWIIARAPSKHLELIRVADGLVLELPQFTALDRPAWRP